MQVIDLEQGSQEWLDYRKTRIGASEAPIIMGVSPLCTPLQLWQKKLGLSPNQEDNSAMQRGRELEPLARKLAESHLDCQLNPLVGESLQHSFLSASFDGFNFEKKLALEIKCPGVKDHSIAKNGEIPEKYIPQLQQQMYLSGLESIVYMSYYSDTDYNFVFVNRDDDFINVMLNKLIKFWNCWQNLEAPELSEQDYVDMSNDDQFNEYSLGWQKAKEDVKQAENLERYYRGLLIELASGKNCKNSFLKISQHQRKGHVDYSKIEILQDIDLEQYRKESTIYWKISEAELCK